MERQSRHRQDKQGAGNSLVAQTRLNSGDLSDARIGATRTRTSIANYFNGTATDLGLVKNGILAETGESVTQVQSRLLGTATSAPLFTEAPGFAVFVQEQGSGYSRISTAP